MKAIMKFIFSVLIFISANVCAQVTVANCASDFSPDLSSFHIVSGDLGISNESGDIYVVGSVTINDNQTYNGEIYATGDIYIGKKARVTGVVYSEGTITKHNNGNVQIGNGSCSNVNPTPAIDLPVEELINSCSDIFKDAAQSHSGGSLTMWGASQLIDDTDEFDFSSYQGNANSCGSGTQCTYTGKKSSSLSSFTIPAISGIDLNAIPSTWGGSDSPNITVGVSANDHENGFYTDTVFGKLKVQQGSITFKAQPIYYIDEIELVNADAALYLSSGTYVVRKFSSTSGSQIKVADGADVYFFVDEFVGSQAELRVISNPNNFNLILNSGIQFYGDNAISGSIYSTGEIKLDGKSSITGRVATNNLTMTSTSKITDSEVCGNVTTTPVYELELDTSSDALTCEPHSVNITVNSSDADGNLTPATDYTGSISLSTSTKKGVWSLISGDGTLSDSNDGTATYEFDSDDNGVIELGLLHTDEGEVTVSIDNGDASADATIIFLSSLIKMDLSCVNERSGVCINTANVPFTLTLTAVQKDEETNSCESYSPATVDFWSEYATGDDEAVEIDAVAIGTDTTTMGATEADATELKLSFSDGVATVAVNYPDAGKIKINVKDESGINGSAETIVNPYKLLISTVTGKKRNNSTTVASTISNLATQAAGNGFIRASVPDYDDITVDTFDVTIQAIINCTSSGYAANCEGNTGNDVYVIAPSFANDITLQPSLIFPTSTSSTTATLGNIYSSTGSNELTSAASAGVVSYENLAYDEVGTMGVQATSVDYIVTGNDVTASDVVKIGRFYPDYLAYGLFSVTEACNDDFTYMDQQDISLGYTMQAYAQSNSTVVTENYDYDLGYPVASNDDFTHMVSDQNANSLTTRLLSDGDYDQQNWLSGVYTVTNLLMGVEKGIEEDGPFFSSKPDGTDNHLDYYIQLTGFDGERLQMNSTTSCTDNLCLLGGLGDIAYGRLQAGNGHGSEYQPIRNSVQATYYDGDNFSSFSRDTCTTLSASQVNKQTISDSENDITALTDLSISNSPLISGLTSFDFSAPNTRGKFNYYIDLHSVAPWLLDSGNAVSCTTDGDKNCISGYVEFGLFRGNDRIINRLQTFN